MQSASTPESPKPNRKIILNGCGCLFALFGLVLLMLIVAPLYNNFRLWRFERNFNALSHPAGTKFLDSAREIGSFGVNGNHCDFKVVELRSFTGSPKPIQQFYATKRVPVPNNEDDESIDVKEGAQQVQVEVLPSPLPPKYKWGWEGLTPFDLSSFAGRKNLYVLYVVNIGPNYSWESTCDFRCE